MLYDVITPMSWRISVMAVLVLVTCRESTRQENSVNRRLNFR